MADGKKEMGRIWFWDRIASILDTAMRGWLRCQAISEAWNGRHAVCLFLGHGYFAYFLGVRLADFLSGFGGRGGAASPARFGANAAAKRRGFGAACQFRRKANTDASLCSSRGAFLNCDRLLRRAGAFSREYTRKNIKAPKDASRQYHYGARL